MFFIFQCEFCFQKDDDKVQVQDMWVTGRDIHMTPTLDSLPTLESVTEAPEHKVGNGHAKPVDSSKGW